MKCEYGKVEVKRWGEEDGGLDWMESKEDKDWWWMIWNKGDEWGWKKIKGKDKKEENRNNENEGEGNGRRKW